MEIKALKGLLYNKNESFEKSVAPPYDVLSAREVDKLYSLSRYNIVRLDFGKILKNDNEKNNRYTRAAILLNEWIKNGILVEEKKETVYIYSQEFLFENSRYKRTGIICDLKLESFEAGNICPHEFTLSKPKTDRLNLLEQTNCNFSEIFCIAFDDKNNINNFISEEKEKTPFVKFKFIDGIVNILWKIDDPGKVKIIKGYFKNERLLIADGHHRYETGLNYQKIMRKKFGPGSWDYIPVYIVSRNDRGLLVLPTHRIIEFENNFEIEKLIKNISKNFYIGKKEKSLTKSDVKILQNQLILKTDKTSYILSLKEGIFKKFNDKQKFPTSVLNNLILNKIGQDYKISYEKDMKKVFKAVSNNKKNNQGNTKIGFILPETSVKSIFNVVRLGERLPEKSTYFYPKILTGLVMRLVNGINK